MNKTIEKHGHILVFAFAFLLYANTIKHGFVLDDRTAITSNSSVQKGIKGIPEILSNSYMYGYSGTNEESYRPVSLILFAVETSFFGDSSSPFHLIHVLLYSILCVVVFKWLCLLFSAYSLSLTFGITLLFVAHPIHTEVVANLKSADELLGLLFGVLSFWLFTKHLEKGAMQDLLLALVCYLLAVLSKETALSYLAVFPLLTWYVTQKNTSAWLKTSVFILPVALYFFLRLNILTAIAFEAESEKLSGANNALLFSENSSEYFGTALSIIGMYFQKLLLPLSFSYDYSFNQIELVEWTNPSALISITVILLMIAAGVFYFLKRNLLAMGIALVISSLVLSSNLILPIAATAAERFLFSPSLGFVIIVGLLFNQLIQSPLGTKVHQLSWMALPIVLLFYSFQTYSRNSDWESNQTLFIKDVETSSNSYRAHHFAAAEYKEVGRKAANLADQQKAYNKSIYHLLESIKIYPDFMGNYEQLADLYKSKGDYPRGEKVALAGLKKDSGNIDLKLHLGDIYLQSKQLKNAQTTFAELIDVVDSTKAYFANYNLAAAYYNDRKFTEAIPYFEKAVQINPAAQDGLYFIGVSLYELEKYQDAIDKLILVTEANANYPWCVFTIGTSYLMLEKYTEAIPYLEKSLAYSPDEIGALAALAKAETEIGNIEKASDYYARIKKLRQ